MQTAALPAHVPHATGSASLPWGLTFTEEVHLDFRPEGTLGHPEEALIETGTTARQWVLGPVGPKSVTLVYLMSLVLASDWQAEAM